MLYDLKWLRTGESFPPKNETDRINNYEHFAMLFDLPDGKDFQHLGLKIFSNFDEWFKSPMLLGYSRLSTIKLADMVFGALPSITKNKDDTVTDQIQAVRDQTDFDNKGYQSVIDYSRFGTTVFRIFTDDEVTETRGNFAIWDPKEWFPIFKRDGTKRIREHVLAWRTNEGDETTPAWFLDVQIHPIEGGSYTERRYKMDAAGKYIGEQIKSQKHSYPGFPCMVQHIANIPTTTNPYGTSDYKIFNELVVRATERMHQILHILDKHADPSMTGPVTMLSDATDGTKVFEVQKFYAVSSGEEHPEYLTWDGELDAAFKALEFLLNQIYIMSEMGEAFLGNVHGTGQAVSGVAMRFKMISPLEKARRVANSFSLPLKKLISTLLFFEKQPMVSYKEISIVWEDSLPKDPRETAELTRLQTGAPAIFPLKKALMENYDMSAEDAEEFAKQILIDQKAFAEINQPRPGEEGNPSAPPNPQRKGSPMAEGKTGTNSRSN